MDVIRKIGNVEVLVDCNLPHDIYFDEDTIQKNNLNRNMSQIDVCSLLSKDEFRPIYLMWEIIDKCNLSCPFCYIVGHSNNKLIRFNDAKAHLDILIEKGLLYCLLTGGEVLLHPDFIQIYQYLRENGVIVEVYTNGVLLNKEHFSIFRRYNPYKIEVTIYGISDDIFRLNTNSKISPKNILFNIEYLHDIGLNVICKTPVNSITEKEFNDIRNWCVTKNIRHYYSTDVSDSYSNSSLQNFSLPIDEKLKYDIENELEFMSKNPGFYESENIIKNKLCFSCSVGSYGIHINSNFELLPCSSFNGKFTGIDIQSIGMQDSLLKLNEYVSSFHKKPIIGCYGCEASDNCKMCPATGDVVISKGKIIGYKTNNAYCESTMTYHKKISEIIALNQNCQSKF